VYRVKRAVAIVVVAGGIGGCSRSHPHTPAHVLRLETANPAGVDHDPAMRFFAARVARLSGGRLRIAFDDRWGRDGDAREASLIRDVADGRAELGIAHTRALALAGARDMDALDAPMLIDRYSLEAAVIASPLAARMLAGTRGAEVEGLALLSGPLARPVGTRGPLRSAVVVDHRQFDVRDVISHGGHPWTSVAQRAANSLGAFVRPLGLRVLTSTYVAGPRTIEAPALYEDDLDSLFFDRYGAQCASPNPGCRTMGPWVTLNVALWPRMSALVANHAALARLTARERGWLRAAAAAAATRSATAGMADQGILDELCAAGVRAASAPRRLVVELAHRWRRFYGQLPAFAIRTIERMRRVTRPDRPLRIPAHCGRRSLHLGPARGVSSTLPDGVYRVRITSADLRFAGANGIADRPGVATLTMRGGHWRLVLTEPGDRVETGTYAGTPSRTAWASEGPAGRDEAYMSITVGRDRTLHFNVARADDLAHARAIYASHPWRRIGS